MTGGPRVVMVSAGFWPALGGAEGQALELSRALLARGAKVLVLTRRVDGLPSRGEAKGVPVRRLRVLGTGALDSLSFLFGAFGWLLKHGAEYDAIHVHLAGSPALAAAAAGRWLGKPVVVKLGGGRGIGELAVSSKTALGRLKLALLARLGPKFLAVVPDLADEAREHLGGADIEILPNGVDAARFTPVPAARKAALRRELGWPAGAVFLYTGRFSWEKRLPWFTKAWLMGSAGKDAALLLAGDGPERPALEAEAAASGGRVRVLPRVDDAAPLYAAADAFVLPSVSEGLSNSLLEAMSSGLAVVASAVGGTAQTVDGGRTGLLFPEGDAAAASAAVAKILADPAAAAALGRAARAEIESKYSLDRVASRCLELYRP